MKGVLSPKLKASFSSDVNAPITFPDLFGKNEGV
jgi:hypothetical protein